MMGEKDNNMNDFVKPDEYKQQEVHNMGMDERHLKMRLDEQRNLRLWVLTLIPVTSAVTTAIILVVQAFA